MYEEVNETEYLEVCNTHLGFDGILDLLEDLQEDYQIKQLNLSYTLNVDDYHNPRNVEAFLRNMRKYLHANKHLTALDFAGNFAFFYHPHPSNEHVVLYQEEFSKIINASKITHVDLSDNNMTGYSGRELKGLLYFLQNSMCKRKAFQCRQNKLSSQGFLAISQGLGVNSTLTYLDISDNLGGLDPFGKPTSDGMVALASALKHCLGMRTVKVARNHLRDNELELLSDAIHDIPTFQDLDFSGNLTKFYGCRSLKLAICSLGVPFGPRTGFRELIISNNSIGDEGIEEICEAIERSQTLRALHIAFCQVTEHGGERLQAALADNSTIVEIDVHGNYMSEAQESLIVAEIEANCLLEDIHNNPLGIDVNELEPHMKEALGRKLHFLSKEDLKQLHHNPSFTIPESELREALHFLQPPPRQVLLQNVVQNQLTTGMMMITSPNSNILLLDDDNSSVTSQQSKGSSSVTSRRSLISSAYTSNNTGKKLTLEERIAYSKMISKQTNAMRVIYVYVMGWFRARKRKQAIMDVFLAEQRRRQAEEEENDEEEDEEDLFSAYSGSIVSGSTSKK